MSNVEPGSPGGCNENNIIIHEDLDHKNSLVFKDIGIIPNPAKTKILIHLPYHQHETTLYIMDAFGKMVYTTKVKEYENKLELPLKNDVFTSGLYYINVVLEGDNYIKKLIISN